MLPNGCSIIVVAVAGKTVVLSVPERSTLCCPNKAHPRHLVSSVAVLECLTFFNVMARWMKNGKKELPALT